MLDPAPIRDLLVTQALAAQSLGRQTEEVRARVEAAPALTARPPQTLRGVPEPRRVFAPRSIAPSGAGGAAPERRTPENQRCYSVTPISGPRRFTNSVRQACTAPEPQPPLVRLLARASACRTSPSFSPPPRVTPNSAMIASFIS